MKTEPTKHLKGLQSYHFKTILILIVLLSFYPTNICLAQCPETEMMVKLEVMTSSSSSMNGDAIKIIDTLSQLEVYCRTFSSDNFVDTLCLAENSTYEIVGFDSVNDYWESALIKITYLNNIDDCGPSSDSTLTDFYSFLNGMGTAECGINQNIGIPLNIFQTPNISCPSAAPVCPIDTLRLTALPNDNYLIVDFLSNVVYEDSLIFNYAVNAETDELFNQKDTLQCGKITEVLLNFQNENGEIFSCDLIYYIKCDTTYSDILMPVILGDTLDEYINKVIQEGNHIYMAGYTRQNDTIQGILRKYNIYSGLLWEVALEKNTRIFDFYKDNNDIYIVGCTYPFANGNHSIVGKISDNGYTYTINFLKRFTQRFTREAIRSIIKDPQTENFILHGHLVTFINDDNITLLKMSKDGNISLKTQLDKLDDQMWNGLQIDYNGNFIFYGEEADGTNEGFFVAVDDSLKVQEAYSIYGIQYIRDLAVDHSDKKKILVSNKHITGLNENNEMIFNKRVNNINIISQIDGPYYYGNKEYYYTITRIAKNDTYFYVVSELEYKDNDIEFVWSKRVNIPSVKENTSNFVVRGYNDILLVQSRIDSIDTSNSNLLLLEYPKDSCYFEPYNLSASNSQVNIESQDMTSEALNLTNFVNLDTLSPSNNLYTELESCANEINCNVNLLVEIDFCNQIHIQAKLDSTLNIDETQLIWTSPVFLKDFKGHDTTFVYEGNANELEFCLSIVNNGCENSICDTLTIDPAEAPIFENCIESISLPYQETCSAFVDFSPPFAYDPCTQDESEVLCLRLDGLELSDAFPLGSSIIQCISTGITGLKSTCTTEVFIYDNIPPVCTNNQIGYYLDENGNDTIYLANLIPFGEDECGSTFFTHTNLAYTFDCSSGNTTKQISIKDESGNTQICNVDFILNDTISPVCNLVSKNITLPKEGKIELPGNFFDNGSFDNCNGLIFPEVIAFDCSHQGKQDISIEISDIHNNITTCDIEVQVFPYDYEISFYAEPVGCRKFEFTLDNTEDILSYYWTVENSSIFSNKANPQLTFPENGSYIIHLSTEMNNGCKNFSSINLDVNHDCESCFSSFEISNNCYDYSFNSNVEGFQLTPIFEWTINDELIAETSNLNYTFSEVGKHTICLKVDDNICQSEQCQEIDVKPILPVFDNCPSDMTIEVNNNCDPIFVELNPQIVFLCGSASNIDDISIIRSDGKNKEESFEKGFTNVLYSFTDEYGYTSECAFNVEVIDKIIPTCQAKSITLALDEFGNAELSAEQIDNGSFDNCSFVLSVNKTKFTCDDLGTQEVELFVSDGFTTSICSAEITIIDSIKPICIFEDTDIYVDKNGKIDIDTDKLLYSVEDNCSEVNMELFGIEDISCQDKKQYLVQIHATDSSNNLSICEAFVNIIDTISPTCSDYVYEAELTTDNIGQQVTINIDSTLYADNCEIAEIIYTPPFYDCANIGLNTSLIQIKDKSNNETTCEITVNILDKIAPSCFIEDMTIDATDIQGAFVNFNGMATDQCDNEDITISYSMDDGGFYECGEYSITMIATDKNGNSSSCDFNLKVKDCDACCLSEEAFMDLTNQKLDTEIQLENNTNCLVQIYPPPLTDCQVVSQIDWGDGTVMNGHFPYDIDFIHEYLTIGEHEICVTMKESDLGECFINQVCQKINISNECQIINNIIPEESEEDIIIFPNPTFSYTNILSQIKIEKIELLNVNGEKIDVNDMHKIDLSSLPSGMYLLRIHFSSYILTRKVIKL